MRDTLLKTGQINVAKKKHDAISTKLSKAQLQLENVRGILKAEFMKWLFRFSIIKLELP